MSTLSGVWTFDGFEYFPTWDDEDSGRRSDSEANTHALLEACWLGPVCFGFFSFLVLFLFLF